MQLIYYIISRWRYWQIKKAVTTAKNSAMSGFPPDLLVKLIDAIYKEGLVEYRIKDGFHIFIDTYYLNVISLIRDLDQVYEALRAADLRPISRLLIKRATAPKLLVDFLVDDTNHIVNINEVYDTLRNRLDNVNAILVAADTDARVYYLRKLTNILRECYVVTEALHKAADLKWQQIHRIKKLLSF